MDAPTSPRRRSSDTDTAAIARFSELVDVARDAHPDDAWARTVFFIGEELKLADFDAVDLDDPAVRREFIQALKCRADHLAEQERRLRERFPTLDDVQVGMRARASAQNAFLRQINGMAVRVRAADALTTTVVAQVTTSVVRSSHRRSCRSAPVRVRGSRRCTARSGAPPGDPDLADPPSFRAVVA